MQFFIRVLKLYLNFKNWWEDWSKEKTCKVSVWTPKCFLSKSIVFISSLLDLYSARALDLLMPDVIGFQLFPPGSMMTCFIFFNYFLLTLFLLQTELPSWPFLLLICLLPLKVSFLKSEIPRIYPHYYLCKCEVNYDMWMLSEILDI